MHHLKPFTIVVLNGEITVYSVDSPKWFWMVGQLIQNLVWIFPNGSTANTKPCLDTSKWWINGPSKTIWMVVQLATNTVQIVSPWNVCTKPMGIFESGNGLSVGELMDLPYLLNYTGYPLRNVSSLKLCYMFSNAWVTLLHLISLICFIFTKATVKDSVLPPIELGLPLTSPDYLMANMPSHALLLNFGTVSPLLSVILLV